MKHVTYEFVEQPSERVLMSNLPQEAILGHVEKTEGITGLTMDEALESYCKNVVRGSVAVDHTVKVVENISRTGFVPGYGGAKIVQGDPTVVYEYVPQQTQCLAA